jgi:DNA-binding YbaB/EbfC family protein
MKSFRKAGGGAGDMSKLLEQAQQMQRSLMDIQENLSEEIVEGKAGGGSVKVKMTGKHEVKNVSIDKDVVDLDDLEMLEDLLVTAFNDAVEKATNLAAERMNAVTGGLPIPGLDGLF